MMVSDADIVKSLSQAFLAATEESAKEAMLDGGAQSFVVGQNTLEKYSDYLRSQSIDWRPKDYPCSRVFSFGHDATNQCATATRIPMNVTARTGHVHV